MKKKIMALSALTLLLLASCSPKVNNSGDASKEEEKSYYPLVTNAEWDKQFKNEKALDPFGNVTITVKNGGKIWYRGSTNPDYTVKVSNGNVYISNKQYANYFVSSPESFDSATGTYKDVQKYDGYLESENGVEKIVWEQNGTGDIDSIAFVASFATPAMQIKNLDYDKFTYNEETKIYECETLVTKGYWLPNDPEYTLKNLSISFRDGKVFYIDYYIELYKTQITATFVDYGTTIVPSIESLMAQ